MDRQAEMHDLLYEDEGCMLLPDTKWDRKDVAAAYVLAILKDSTIRSAPLFSLPLHSASLTSHSSPRRSVRDLRGEHLPMLLKIQAGVLAKLTELYGTRPDSVRAYMHYHPSFWWAHIHFSAITCPNLGFTTSLGKAILFDDILDNLERDSLYYADASLTVGLGESEPLFAAMLEAGAIKALPPKA